MVETEPDYGEPWEAHLGNLHSGITGKVIYYEPSEESGGFADARFLERVCLCVNACKGVPDAKLAYFAEYDGFAALLERSRETLAVLDPLLHRYCPGFEPKADTLLVDALKKLAKAREKSSG